MEEKKNEALLNIKTELMELIDRLDNYVTDDKEKDSIIQTVRNCLYLGLTQLMEIK